MKRKDDILLDQINLFPEICEHCEHKEYNLRERDYTIEMYSDGPVKYWVCSHF